MKVLALEPYYGGSHRAFLDGWVARSCHEWTLLTLPDSHWKWRMRHGAITLARQVRSLAEQGHGWEVLFCSDMLNLAEFLGLAGPDVQRLPRVVYFHENQLTYPVQREQDRDLHFAFTNITTALAAGEVWFNSAFHRDEFLASVPLFFKRMPDKHPAWVAGALATKSRVQYPGVESIAQTDVEADRGGLGASEGFAARERKPGPLRVLWAARWEFDKNPETLLRAVELLERAEVDYRLAVIGEQFAASPDAFAELRWRFESRIDHWGFQPARQDYENVLRWADVFISTAHHEFFGIATVEAIAGGCYPLLPRRLSYPELVQLDQEPGGDEFFYDGSAEELFARIRMLADSVGAEGIGALSSAARARAAVSRVFWQNRVGELDRGLEDMGTARLK